MVFTKIRRVVIILLLMMLCSYFTIAFTSDLEQKSQKELEQASFRVGEYLDIIVEFADNVSDVGNNYFSAENVKIDDDFYGLEFDDNFIYHSTEDLTDMNRRIIGVGSEYTVDKDAKYINIAYVFDRFFRDFSLGYNSITGINYYSNHNFVYSYSSRGEEYLNKLGYFNEKYKNEKLSESFKYGEDIVWNEEINKDYLNERELIVSTPVYENDNIEGIISIKYSLNLIDEAISSNYYKTYLIDKDGVIISSNDHRFQGDSFANIKQDDLFGENEGSELISELFYGNEKTSNKKLHVISSEIIEDQFIIVTYISPFIYITGVLSSVLAIIVIGKIIFWLNDTYERRIKVRAELRQKYAEVSKFKVSLEEVATTDFLTKLYNRRYMIERIEQERMFNKTDHDALFIILMMDIDHFKSVNDTFGHKAGDEVLKSVALSISNNVRKIDLVSRWGGEEMLVVLVNSSMDEGLRIAERIREKVSEAVTTVDETDIKVTLSIGVEKLRMNDNFDNALVHADEALYEAKTSGRNRIVVYKNKHL